MTPIWFRLGLIFSVAYLVLLIAVWFTKSAGYLLIAGIIVPVLPFLNLIAPEGLSPFFAQALFVLLGLLFSFLYGAATGGLILLLQRTLRR